MKKTAKKTEAEMTLDERLATVRREIKTQKLLNERP